MDRCAPVNRQLQLPPGCLVAVAVVMLDLIRAGLNSHWSEEADKNIELFA
jgi:hypothetical protein